MGRFAGCIVVSWAALGGLACDDYHLLAVLADADAPDDAAVGDGPREDASSEDVDGAAEDVPDSEADGAPDDAGGGTLTVRVVRNPSFPSAGLEGLVEGAAVALDPPGGGRVEATTDENGLVKFVDLDWSAGTATVMAHAPDHSVAGRTGIAAPGGEVLLVLEAWSPPSWMVEVTGTVLHLDPIGCLRVSATVPHVGLACAPGPDYAIHVQPDTPFTLVAWGHWMSGADGSREADWPIPGWVQLDHPGVSATTTLDLDFAAEPPVPHRVHGSFALPSSPSSLLAVWATGGVFVLSSDLGMILGGTEHTEVSADETTVEFDVAWLAPPGVTGLLTEYFLLMPPWPAWVASVTFEEGPPTAGAHAPEFLEMPGVTTPRRTVHGTIAWELYDRGVGTWLQVSRESDSRVLVLLEGPVDATALAIPALPSTVDEDELFGTDALVVSVGVFRPDSTGTYTRQFATTEPLAIAR